LGFRRVDVAEIAPGIVDAARRHFEQINGRVLDRPGVRLFLEDGRNHLLLHQTKYDQITIELTSAWFSGATNLYSREFYELCRERLNEGGIIQQWIQIHHIGIDELGSVIATMRKVFAHVSFWVYGGQGILVGSEEPQKIQAAAVETFFRTNPSEDPDEPAMKRRLAGILRARLLAPEDTDRMLAAIAFNINTDANRYLEYATPRYNLSRLPHAAINTGILRQYATFPKHQPEPAWPAVFANPESLLMIREGAENR
jgi:spermidine synthase